MVYINETSGTVSLPRHTQDVSSAYTLVLSSNLSNSVRLVDNGSNISTNPLYYKFAFNNQNLNVGEYTYNLTGTDNSILETGLLTYGAYNREVIVNNTTNKQKIQYNG